MLRALRIHIIVLTTAGIAVDVFVCQQYVK